MRVAVVGASSGLGRTIALGLAENGASVAFLARRKERLTEVAAIAGNGAVAIPCDVTVEQSCHDAIADASAVLGGLDGLVYAARVGAMMPLAQTEAATCCQST